MEAIRIQMCKSSLLRLTKLKWSTKNDEETDGHSNEGY